MMPKSLVSVTTLLQVAQWLRVHGPVSAEELGAHFHLSADDVDALVEQLGDTYFGRDLPWTKLEIDWNAYAQRREVCLVQDYGIAGLQQLTRADAFTLTVALWFLVTSGVLADQSAALRLADRLIGAFNLGRMWKCFHYVTSTDISLVRIAALESALAERALQITYTALSGRRSHRTVVVESVELSDGQWLIVAFCTLTGQLRRFRCDRISDWQEVPVPVEAEAALREHRVRQTALVSARPPRIKRRLEVSIDPRWRWALTNASAPRRGRWVLAVEDERWAENQLLRLGRGLRSCSDQELLVKARNRARTALDNYETLGLI